MDWDKVDENIFKSIVFFSTEMLSLYVNYNLDMCRSKKSQG